MCSAITDVNTLEYFTTLLHSLSTHVFKITKEFGFEKELFIQKHSLNGLCFLVWFHNFSVQFMHCFQMKRIRKYYPSMKHTKKFYINPFTPKFKNYVPSPNLFKRKCVSEAVRIGSILIFHLSKL